MTTIGKINTAEITTEELPTQQALKQLHNQIDNLFRFAGVDSR